jgi:hypothetical protein
LNLQKAGDAGRAGFAKRMRRDAGDGFARSLWGGRRRICKRPKRSLGAGFAKRWGSCAAGLSPLAVFGFATRVLSGVGRRGYRAAPKGGKVIVYLAAEFPDADASKRAAAFAASKVSAVPLTIKSVSLLSVFDLRCTSHVGTLSCVKTNNMHSPTSANSAGLGHSGGSGFHSISAMSCRLSSSELGAILRR